MHFNALLPFCAADVHEKCDPDFNRDGFRGGLFVYFLPKQKVKRKICLLLLVILIAQQVSLSLKHGNHRRISPTGIVVARRG
jgi:hypothetical protein